MVSRWITRILVFLRIFSQVEIRFISNNKIYEGFNKNSKSILSKIFPPYYKELILVKSKIYDKNNKKLKDKISNKYIVHLDQDPDYREMKVVDELDKNLIKDHYIKLNNLLNLLSKTYKKKVIISIHPLYDQKKQKKDLKIFK